MNTRRLLPSLVVALALATAAAAAPPAVAVTPAAAPAEAPATAAPAAAAQPSGVPAEAARPRRARSLHLDEPVVGGVDGAAERAVEARIEQRSEAAGDAAIEGIDKVEVPVSGDGATVRNAPFFLLETEVPAGTATRLAWQPGESIAGVAAPTPVLVVHGTEPGPVLCLTAAVHGDELNGIEMVRRILYELDPLLLKGTVVGIPIVNLPGFRNGSRYLPDRRDLNRHFPGSARGSSAARIAQSFFQEIILHCKVLVDIHTGSFYRTNLPQLRADLQVPAVAAIAEAFTSTAVVHSPGASGSLRRAAVEAGITTVTLEAGEPMRLQRTEIDLGVRGLWSLIDQLGMYRKLRVWGNPVPVHYQSRWVRTDIGGMFFGLVKLGQEVGRGDLLGSVTDPITNLRADILAPWDGRVIGMAVDQVVLPGFAAFHIGIRAAPDGADQPAAGGSGNEAEPSPETESRDSMEDS